MQCPSRFAFVVLLAASLLGGCEGDRLESYSPAQADAFVSLAPDRGPDEPPEAVERETLIAALTVAEQCRVRVMHSSRLDRDALDLRLLGEGAALLLAPSLAGCLAGAESCDAAVACAGCRLVPDPRAWGGRVRGICADQVVEDGCDLGSPRCEGSVLSVCQAGVRWTVDCALGDRTCGHQEWSVPGCYQGCRSPSSTCDAGTLVGECHGDTRGVAFDNVANHWPCGLLGDRACRKVPGASAECVLTSGGCDAPPRCEGAMLVVCLGGEARRIDCAAGGGTCKAAGDFIGCVQGG